MMHSDQITLFRYIEEHLSFYMEKLREIVQSSNIYTHTLDVATNAFEATLLAHQHKLDFHTKTTGQDAGFLYASQHNAATHSLLLYHACPLAKLAPSGSEDSFHLSPRARAIAPIVACLAALDAYQQTLGTLPINILWLIDCTNEDNPSRLDEMLQQHIEPGQIDGCLWSKGCITADGIPILALGTKGLLKVALEVCTAHASVHSMHGAIAPNALWRLTWALNSLKNVHEEILIEGFYDTLLSAQDDEIELLSRLPDLSSVLAQKWGVERLLWGLQGFQLNYAHLLTPTCTIHSIRSETMPADVDTTIPVQARAYLDFYLVPDQDPLDIFQKLQRHLIVNDFADISVHLLYASKPAHSIINAPFVQAVYGAATAAYGNEPWVLPYASEGRTIAAFQHILNLPTVLTGISYPEENGYTVNEQDYRRDFCGSIKHLAILFEEVGHTKRS
jgi:acetylornithine deacetylase/succinyl-diaminopimelate desuccinylase-like protein